MDNILNNKRKRRQIIEEKDSTVPERGEITTSHKRITQSHYTFEGSFTRENQKSLIDSTTLTN